MPSTPISPSAVLENGQSYTFSFNVADIGFGNWNDSAVAAALSSDPDLSSVQVSSQSGGFLRNITTQVVFVFVGPGGLKQVSEVAQNIADIIGSMPSLSLVQFVSASVGVYMAPVSTIGATLGTSTSTDPNVQAQIDKTQGGVLDSLNSTIKWTAIALIVGLVGMMLLAHEV